MILYSLKEYRIRQNKKAHIKYDSFNLKIKKEL